MKTLIILRMMVLAWAICAQTAQVFASEDIGGKTVTLMKAGKIKIQKVKLLYMMEHFNFTGEQREKDHGGGKPILIQRQISPEGKILRIYRNNGATTTDINLLQSLKLSVNKIIEEVKQIRADSKYDTIGQEEINELTKIEKLANQELNPSDIAEQKIQSGTSLREFNTHIDKLVEKSGYKEVLDQVEITTQQLVRKATEESLQIVKSNQQKQKERRFIYPIETAGLVMNPEQKEVKLLQIGTKLDDKQENVEITGIYFKPSGDQKERQLIAAKLKEIEKE